MTVVAMQMVDMNAWAQQSYRVWMLRQSMGLQNMFSTLRRWR